MVVDLSQAAAGSRCSCWSICAVLLMLEHLLYTVILCWWCERAFSAAVFRPAYTTPTAAPARAAYNPMIEHLTTKVILSPWVQWWHQSLKQLQCTALITTRTGWLTDRQQKIHPPPPQPSPQARLAPDLSKTTWGSSVVGIRGLAYIWLARLVCMYVYLSMGQSISNTQCTTSCKSHITKNSTTRPEFT